jgi:type IV secretory pathway VirB2 component (pilin)
MNAHLAPRVSLDVIPRFAVIVGAILSVLLTVPAYAAGSNMPWEAPLTQPLDSIQGPVVRIFAVIIIAFTGPTLAFGDTSGGFRRLIPSPVALEEYFHKTQNREPVPRDLAS